MILRIANQTGRIHHAAQHPEFASIRPCYAFVPENYFGANGFERLRYLTSRWPSINAGANPLSIGSHVLPDATKPVSPRLKCPIFSKFLIRLETITTIKSTHTAE